MNKTDDLSKHFCERVVCITIIDRKENLIELQNEFNSSVENVEIHLQENSYTPGWYWLTVHSHLASKDLAINTMLDHCDLKDADVTAFGDNTNDIKMLMNATTGIAVGNALDELKKVADLIIDPSFEDSVVIYIANVNNIKLVEI